MGFYKKFFTIIFIIIFIFLFLIPNSYGFQIEQSTMPQAVLNQIRDIVNNNYNWTDYGMYCGRFQYSYILFIYNKTIYTNVGMVWKDYYSNSMAFMPAYEADRPHYDTWYIPFDGSYSEKTRTDYDFPRNYSDGVYNLSEYYLYNVNRNVCISPSVINPFYKNLDALETPPYILNSSTDIEDWSFEYLSIYGGSVSPYFNLDNNNYPYLFNLKITYNNVDHVLDIVDYTFIDTSNNTFNINIPCAYLTIPFLMTTNSDISFTLELQEFDNNGDITNTTSYSLGTYSFTLTSAQVDSINNDSQRFIENINTNNINNINNSINNSNIKDDNVSNFNNINDGMSITDNSGIDTIFQNIYNAFTTKYNDNNIGYGYTLSLPIPFTDKTINISPHTVFGRSWNDLYENENKYDIEAIQIIYRFVGTIWWFVIGLWVLKDVRSVINKVAEGEIENVGSDIKKELL